MSFMTKATLGGVDYWVGWPMSEYIMHDGIELSCKRWPGRVSDCFVNGRRVNQIIYQAAKRGDKRLPQMTPERLRFRLKRYVRPLGGLGDG